MQGAIAWQKDSGNWPFQLPELLIDPSRTGLLIVDMSNFSETAAKVVPNNIKLLNFFRENKLVVMYCLVGSLLPDARDVHLKRRLTWQRKSGTQPLTLCPKGSFDYEVVEALRPLPAEPVIDKNSRGAFNSSVIDHYLRAMDVQNLVVTGVGTSACVEGTARDAADRGYNVILVSDACNGSDRDQHRVTLHTFPRFFGAVKSTAEIIADLSGLLAKRAPCVRELTR
ncbi:MAG: cysteine hydrolase [Chloroflexi bacterium]|nr:cysteine hydrolase [Chloroflexota bacterium]